MAISYSALCQYADARKLFEETVALRKIKLGLDHRQTLASMSALVTAYLALGQHADALKLCEETLALQKAKLGPDDPDTFRTMADLATIYGAMGWHTDALKLEEQTLALRKAKLGPHHLDTLQSMGGLVVCYSKLHRIADAQNLCEEALALMKANLGPNHAITLKTMHTMAECYSALGRHADAVQLDEEMLALLKVGNGPDDPGILDIWGHLSINYSRLGQHAHAIKKLEEALAFSKTKLGSNHSTTFMCMDGLAWSLLTCPDTKLRDPGRAVELAKNAVAGTPTNSDFWNTLGAAYCRAGDSKAAITALEKSMQLAANGSDSVNLFFLAMAHWQLGDKDKARRCYDKGVEWMDKHKPQDEELRRFLRKPRSCSKRSRETLPRSELHRRSLILAPISSQEAAGEEVPRSYVLTGPSIAPAQGLLAGRSVVSIVSQAGLSEQGSDHVDFVPQVSSSRFAQTEDGQAADGALEDRLTPAGFGPEDGAYIIAQSWAGSYRDVKIQPPDQKIVAAGSSNARSLSAATIPRGRLTPLMGVVAFQSIPCRWSRSMARFGTSTRRQSRSELWCLLDHISVQHGVVRFKSNGSLDNTFGFGDPDGILLMFARMIVSALQTLLPCNPRAISCSQARSYPTSGNPALVASFTASGKLDSGKGGFGTISQGKALGYSLSTFGGDINFFADSVVLPNDSIVAVGSSRNVPGFLIARFTANGVLDTSFNGSGFAFHLPGVAEYTAVQAIAQQADGKFVVVGRCAGIDGSGDLLVARLNANLTLDTTFGGGSGYVQLDIDGNASQTQENARDVVIQPDGKIVVVGLAGGPSSTIGFIARFSSDGTVDATFGSGGIKFCSPPVGHTFNPESLALKSNGDIIVAGSDNDGTTTHPLLMRFFGGSPLMAAGGTAHAVSGTKSLSIAQVEPLLHEALARWQLTGADVSRCWVIAHSHRRPRRLDARPRVRQHHLARRQRRRPRLVRRPDAGERFRVHDPRQSGRANQN